MSHDQLPSEKKINDLPSIDETVAPEPEFQYQAGSGLSAQQMSRLAELEEKDRRNEMKGRRKKRVVIGSLIGGGALMAIGAVASVAPNLINGGTTSAEPDLGNEPGNSGPAVPGDTEPTVAPELPTTLEGENVMFSFEDLGNDGGAAFGNFTMLLGNVVNDRLDNGGEAIEGDMQYFVSDNAMPQVEAFVDSYVSHLNDERNKAAESGYAGTVDLGIALEETVSEKSGNGFDVTSGMSMLAVDSESGDLLGYVTSNIETYSAHFSATKIELADGTVQDTIIVDSFEQNQPKP